MLQDFTFELEEFVFEFYAAGGGETADPHLRGDKFTPAKAGASDYSMALNFSIT